MKAVPALAFAFFATSCSEAQVGDFRPGFLSIKDVRTAKTNNLLVEIAHLTDSRLPCISESYSSEKQAIERRFQAVLPAVSKAMGTDVGATFKPRPAGSFQDIVCREEGRSALDDFNSAIAELERRYSSKERSY